MNTKNIVSLLFAVTVVFCLGSCKKNTAVDSSDDTIFDAASKHGTTEVLVQNDNDVLNSLDNSFLEGKTIVANIDYGLPGCAIKTVSGTFPHRVVTIDFGNVCTDSFNIQRKGIVHIQIDGYARRVGDSAIMTFDNYYVNGYHRQGKITWNCISRNSDSVVWTRRVDTGKITSPNGNYWLHSGSKTVVQKGVPSPTEYVITGAGSVTNSSGNTFVSQIISPLHKIVGCPRIVSGTINYIGTNHNALLDYGTGVCDSTATISIDGGSPRTITLL